MRDDPSRYAWRMICGAGGGAVTPHIVPIGAPLPLSLWLPWTTLTGFELRMACNLTVSPRCLTELLALYSGTVFR